MYHINRVAVHQRLFVEFFCDYYEILSFEFILVTLLVFIVVATTRHSRTNDLTMSKTLQWAIK